MRDTAPEKPYPAFLFRGLKKYATIEVAIRKEPELATNEYFKVGHNVSLPVSEGTVSSQPFRLGVLNGVTQTDAGDGGNAETHASTKLDGAHWLDVTGAIEPGDVVYISGEGANATLHSASAVGRLVFGAALTSKGTGTGKVAVLVDTINTDAAAV